MAQMLNTKPDNAVLRIVQDDRRMRLRLSVVRRGDQTFLHAGRVVLALDRNVGETLSLGQVCVRKTVNGPRLRLKR
jgi:hypothetical protein